MSTRSLPWQVLRRIGRVFCALLLTCFLLPAPAATIQAAGTAQPGLLLQGQQAQLLQNGSFEAGLYHQKVSPADWTRLSYYEEVSDFLWDSAVRRSDKYSVKIVSSSASHAYWSQTVPVRPQSIYTLSGWVKTLDVDCVAAPFYGASLSMGSQVGSGICGTNDWTRVSLRFSSGNSKTVEIGLRLGHQGSETKGTAWFDDVTVEGPSPVTRTYLPHLSGGIELPPGSPRWKILGLIYTSTDFSYQDHDGVTHRLIAHMTSINKELSMKKLRRFIYTDIPQLNSGMMLPELTIRVIEEPIRLLSPMAFGDYAPDPFDIGEARDPAFDSIIVLWDGSGEDAYTGKPLDVQGGAYAWPMGSGQTYDAIHAGFIWPEDTNVFKHEWGHSIVFYYDATGTAPKPPVDNHINNEYNQYVHCGTGEPYILTDESDGEPIPNSIYHNLSGFTHDYYSGTTARPETPDECLGITGEAWASGGPVTRPPGMEGTAGAGPQDKTTLGDPVPYLMPLDR